MDSKEIKYICYYDMPGARIKRNYVLSATNKLDYIWRVLNRAGYTVEVISASNCVDPKIQYVKGSVQKIGENISLKLFPGMGGPKILQVLGRYWLLICFFVWFLIHVRKGEKIIVYHSLGYCKLLSILKSLTGCYLIGEIEELYQDVSPQKKAVRRAEFEFIYKCDAYIFPTYLLNDKLNQAKKPNVIVHGIYEVEPSRGVKWNDSDIHVVYAGTFDPNKGVTAAVAAAEYLPKGYHIHVCGFGSERDTECLMRIIKETNAKTEATVTYDGLMSGESFICFLQKCQIGLCTQNPEASFNMSSFPSKILTYLSNGLRVVSIRIPAIEFSGVGDCISYYDTQSSKEIAEAIIRCKKINSWMPQILLFMDNQFLLNLTKIVER